MHHPASLFVAVLIALPLTLAAQQSAVHYRAPDGSKVLIDVGAVFPTTVQRLKAKTVMAPGLPVLHQDSTSGGKIASIVKDDSLIVWLQPAGHRDGRRATRATIRLGKPDQAITPSWWPRLQKPWSRRAIDQRTVTTTLMGWTRSGVASTRARIVAAAAQAGLSTSDLGQKHKRPGDGDLVFFTGARKEMMVTFSRIGRRTGVVAHLTEVKR